MTAALTTCFLLICSVPAQAEAFSAKVTRIVDGDTLEVIHNGTQIHKVRLYAIDAPERKQPYGETARAYVEAVALRQTVRLGIYGTDRYGRLLADVTLPDGTLLNYELVKRGLAWWYRKYASNLADYELAQCRARQSRRGFWRAKNPTPPWEWRKSKH